MNNVEYTSCRLCGQGDQKIILRDLIAKDKGRFSLIKCPNCSFVSIYPLPSDKRLQRHYNQNYWQAGNSESSFALNMLYKLRMMNIISHIRKYTNTDSRLLDWGCGDGSFLKLLRNLDFDCYGIDAYAKDANDSKIIRATIDGTDFPDEFFDVITCFHVLEHLSDPLRSIEKAFRLLKINGLMIMEVPNLDSLGFSMFKKKWQPLEIPTHLNHFTPDTLQKLFEHTGKTQIVKREFFSHRISPSALVLSVFSSLAPRKTRGKYNGRYPMPLLGIYFSLQLLAYPFAILGSLIGRGEIIRMYIRKCN